MNVYLSDIESAAIIFAFVAAIITLPYMVIRYRKLGSVPWLPALVLFSFIFYILCAYCLVLLPLPDDYSIIVPGAETPRLIPFNSFEDLIPIITGDEPLLHKFKLILTAPCIIQYLFNILLLLPLGMYLRYWFRRDLKQTVLICLAVSFSFEFLQFTGILGIYEHPYRFADVDDLIANTLGGYLGYLLCGPIERALPTKETIEQNAREAGLRASTTRRVVSFFLDFFFIDVTATLLLSVLQPLLSSQLGMDDDSSFFGLVSSGLGPLMALVAFGLVPAITKGQTLGQKIVRIYIARLDGSRAPWYQCLARYAVLWCLVMAPLYVIYGVVNAVRQSPELNDALMQFLEEFEMGIILFGGILAVAYLLSLVARGIIAWRLKIPFVMLNGLITRTRVLSVHALENAEAEAETLAEAETETEAQKEAPTQAEAEVEAPNQTEVETEAEVEAEWAT